MTTTARRGIMSHQVIRADEVKPGDRIYNSGPCVHPAFRWVNVRQVEPTNVPTVLESGRTVQIPGVRIVTSSWVTYLCADQGIAVDRIEPTARRKQHGNNPHI